MYLKQLTLVNFKNYQSLEIDFCNRINCFTGNNGAGKTNILDAIYYLSFSKSYFSNPDIMNIKHGEQLMLLQGNYSINNTPENIILSYENGKKKLLKRNKKEYDKFSDHIGLIPLVMVSPGDINLIVGNSDERRKFIDGIISQYNSEYLFSLQRYNKALAQRNFILKEFRRSNSFDSDMLLVYNSQLVTNGNFIFNERQKFIASIIPIFQHYFTIISQNNETVSINYKSQLFENSFDNALVNNFNTDLQLKHTTFGVHKDDIELLQEQIPIKKIGSQGQQKTFLISLKLAQFNYINSKCGFNPILLLDDVFDKLDNTRVKQIVLLVAQNNFGQIFITDTNAERVNQTVSEINGSYIHYNVDKAKVKKINEAIENTTT